MKNYTIKSFNSKTPVIPKSCTIMDNVVICGDVVLGEECVIMPGVVIRAEHNQVVIGDKTNIQDLSCIHVELGDNGGVTIGKCVTIGHGAIIHGCDIGDRSVIGMGAIIQDYATVEEECLIGAGTVVTSGTVIPKGCMAVGIPAKVRRPITEGERADIDVATNEYLEYARIYKEENN